MANPQPVDTDALIVVNVKKVRVTAWERFKKYAADANDDLGPALSDLIDRALDGSITETTKPDYATVLARLAPFTAAGLNRLAAADVSALVSAYAREALGEAPRPKRPPLVRRKALTGPANPAD